MGQAARQRSLGFPRPRGVKSAMLATIRERLRGIEWRLQAYAERRRRHNELRKTAHKGEPEHEQKEFSF